MKQSPGVFQLGPGGGKTRYSSRGLVLKVPSLQLGSSVSVTPHSLSDSGHISGQSHGEVRALALHSPKAPSLNTAALGTKPLAQEPLGDSSDSSLCPSHQVRCSQMITKRPIVSTMQALCRSSSLSESFLELKATLGLETSAKTKDKPHNPMYCSQTQGLKAK